MNTSIFLKLYIVAVVTFFIIDLVWLGVVARSFYQNQMGHLMRADVNWAAAIVFYLVFVVGIVVLAVWPAVERQSLGRAIALGALLGLVTYAAYDLTNLATAFVLLPLVPIGVKLGVVIQGKLDEKVFYQISYWALLGIGVKLLYDGAIPLLR